MAKKKEIPAPNDVAEVDQWIVLLAQSVAKRAAIVAAAEAEVREIKANCAVALRSIDEEIKIREAGIGAYATTHRRDLLPDGAKTVKLPNGEISWRWGNWTVKIPQKLLDLFKGPVKGILTIFPPRFVRHKYEPDRERMVSDWQGAIEITGVKVVREERLYIKFDSPEFAALPEVEGPRSSSEAK